MMESKLKIGETVLVPMQVVEIGFEAYTINPILSLRPVEKSSGEMYSENVIKRITVYEEDVMRYCNLNKGNTLLAGYVKNEADI